MYSPSPAKIALKATNNKMIMSKALSIEVPADEIWLVSGGAKG